MREGSPPSPRFASLRADVAVPAVPAAATSTVADVIPFLIHVRLLFVQRLQALLRVVCNREKQD